MFGLFDKIPYLAGFLGDPIFAMVLKESYPVGAFTGNSYLWYYPATPANKEFVQKYMDYAAKKGDADAYPPEAAFAGYMAARFLTEAMLKAKSAKTEDVINALEGLALETASRSFDDEGLRPSDHVPFFHGRDRSCSRISLSRNEGYYDSYRE